MKKKITLTDKLLAAALLISLLATVFHPAIPALLCTVVHIAVTVLVSVVHVAHKAKTEQVLIT